MSDVVEVSLEAWMSAQKRARVFKEGEWWTWVHDCGWKSIPTDGYPHKTQLAAFLFAWHHTRGCVT